MIFIFFECWLVYLYERVALVMPSLRSGITSGLELCIFLSEGWKLTNQQNYLYFFHIKLLDLKTLCNLERCTWNYFSAQIELHRDVNTLKHGIQKLIFDEIEKDPQT